MKVRTWMQKERGTTARFYRVAEISALGREEVQLVKMVFEETKIIPTSRQVTGDTTARVMFSDEEVLFLAFLNKLQEYCNRVKLVLDYRNEENSIE